MPRKKNASPVALIERAVLVACANARLPGWRQAQMKVFAHKLGVYPIPEAGVDLERECARIVRSAGYRYARKLLNWLSAVKGTIEVRADKMELPIGIPKQIPGIQKEVSETAAPVAVSGRRYHNTPLQTSSSLQQRLM